MKTELNHYFELPDDNDWGRKFWKGFALAVLMAAMISLGLIRLGAYLAERWCG